MTLFLRKGLLILFAVGITLVGLAGIDLLQRGRTPPIDGPRSVASLEKITLGGVDQWILVRGWDRTKPVVLFLHGGPGMPAMFLAHAFQRGLERDFVMVQWDRRGAGKSFAAAQPLSGLSVSQTLADTWELTRRLRERFHQSRIYLVGHSWGSYLGLLAVRGHPEYYRAFVGTGQLAGTHREVQLVRLPWLRRMAAQRGDREMLTRLAAGRVRVTEDDLFNYGGELYASRSFWPILLTGLMSPEYTLRDALNVRQGADLVGREMKYDLFPRPLEGEIPKLDVPVFFFLGRHDYNTPSELAAAYLHRLSAPLKGLVWFDRSAHFPFFEEPERFHQELVRMDRAVRRYWQSPPSIPAGEH